MDVLQLLRNEYCSKSYLRKFVLTETSQNLDTSANPTLSKPPKKPTSKMSYHRQSISQSREKKRTFSKFISKASPKNVSMSGSKKKSSRKSNSRLTSGKNRPKKCLNVIQSVNTNQSDKYWLAHPQGRSCRNNKLNQSLMTSYNKKQLSLSNMEKRNPKTRTGSIWKLSKFNNKPMRGSINVEGVIPNKKSSFHPRTKSRKRKSFFKEGDQLENQTSKVNKVIVYCTKLVNSIVVERNRSV